MVHGDDHGLVLPPKIAPIQIVIIPLFFKGHDSQLVLNTAKDIEKNLKNLNFRVLIDDREQYTSGWKFNNWELRGVPLRIEIGPKDLEKNQVTYCRRDKNKEKFNFSLKDDLGKNINSILNDIHDNLFQKAKLERDSHRILVKTWNEFVSALEKKKCLFSSFL